jgi:NADPH-dependent glutamate synthase beta subunit-like oxidoreductase/coenzyme F420-reducing hydrogenase delta subunit/Pyruvate/2-oxoacid:ferredoxin oxidoreductase delta subunit
MTMEQDTRKIRVTAPADGRVWELSPLEISPCTLACPTRINARGYVSLVSDGRFEEALALIRERNPFPGVCGRVCPRPCEAACVRAAYDAPIAICALKRFVFDLEMERGIDPAVRAAVTRTDRVAIVGAGPAGLSAARELALLGYPVTVFEARETPGGMMNLIPEFRLPRRVVRREARSILDMGIELRAGVRFGRDVTWGMLKRRGYKALLLATGAWRPAWKWGGPGVKGVAHAIDFLEHAALELEDRTVIVAGGGAMALDCARTAARLGARRVTLVIQASRELAPLGADDLAQAEAEGVATLFLARPSRLVTRNGRLVGVRCVRLAEGPADATGRRGAVEISGSEFAGEADVFVDAYTRGVELKGLGSNLKLSLSEGLTLAVDPATSGTGLGGVYAAGDLVTGPRSVVEAVQSGQKAAYRIHQHLSGEQVPSPFDLTVEEGVARREFMLHAAPDEAAPRVAMPLEGARERRRDFREVERGYTSQAARKEAARCLRCGPCGECEVCVDVCEKKDLLLSVGNDLGVSIHAGREFWTDIPERVILELGDERSEAKAVRTVCEVSEERCVGCGRCQDVCGYRAVQVEARPAGRFIARVDELACKGCGTCVAACPTGAIDQVNFEDAALLKRLGEIVPARTKVLFVCRWARPERLDLPGDVLVIETMCAGRVGVDLLMSAVLRGSPRVLVCGCGEERCHYEFGGSSLASAVARCAGLLKLFGFAPGTVSHLATTPGEFALAVNKWAWKTK